MDIGANLKIQENAGYMCIECDKEIIKILISYKGSGMTLGSAFEDISVWVSYTS